VLRASSWQDYADAEEIVKEGEMDDRFYIIVQGRVGVQRHSKALGYLDSGDCFGETSYVRGAKRTATIIASGSVTVMKVSSTLLEQVSAECQLRFNQVFLRSMIGRLQSAERGAA
jgi:eukaryotic-like serine/threonine-protein kinase